MSIFIRSVTVEIDGRESVSMTLDLTGDAATMLNLAQQVEWFMRSRAPGSEQPVSEAVAKLADAGTRALPLFGGEEGNP